MVYTSELIIICIAENEWGFMPRIETIISEEEQKYWKDFCVSQGKSSSEILRAFVRNSIEKENFSDLQKATKSEKLTEQINLKLSKRQVQDIQNKAEIEGYEKATRWIRSALMGFLYKEPILTDPEIICLRESTQSLIAIGRNLNQITRSLNIDFRESDKLKFDMIEHLKKMVEKQKKHTALLIKKSISRWENKL